MCWVVELELSVRDDLPGAAFLIGELAVLEGDDWGTCAGSCLSLE